MTSRKVRWKGVFTALATPFDETGQIDWSAFRALLKEQKDAGIAGVIPCGTTGESPTLSLDEKKELITVSLKELKGSGTRVIPGTGSNNTLETLEFSKWASDQGVEGILVVTPYYNKPSQVGLIRHYTQIADAVKCDVILYNVPGRTAVSLTAETVAQLAAHPRIAAIKEATGNLAFLSEIIDSLHLAKKELALLTGDDPTYLPFLSLGGDGVISVASNIIPKPMVALQSAVDSGNWKEARAIHERYFIFMRDLFVEANPVPLKYAMSVLKKCRNKVRSPLSELSLPNTEKVNAALARAGIR